VFKCNCRTSLVSRTSDEGHDHELMIAMVKVTGAFQKSSEIMKVTNQLVKLPQLSATMREMSMEMMKVRLSLPFTVADMISGADSSPG